MPSVYSVSKATPRDCSTVITPSLPTFSITSAIRLPISLSAAEIEATWAISSRPWTSVAIPLIASTILSVARSMPCFSSIGFAPAVTFFRPSLTIACARTVAVVVPSPATSLVLVAASLRSCAPMFSKGSESSISLATVTPSWVTVGAPNFLSSATLRPLGPRVVLTALASVSMPVLSDRRASSLNSRILGTASTSSNSSGLRTACRSPGPRPSACRLLPAACRLLVDDGEDVLLAEDQELLVLQLELGAGVLGEEHDVADLDVHLQSRALVADGEHLAALRLLLAGVGQDDAAAGGLLAGCRADDDPVAHRLQPGRGGGLSHGSLSLLLLRRARGAPAVEPALALDSR